MKKKLKLDGYEENVLYFDAMGKSILWDLAYASAKPFIPMEIQEIDIIVPHPFKSGSLILATDTFYYSPDHPLETLKDYVAAYSFADYEIMSTCLRSFHVFGQYKTPLVTPYFALCPLEGGERATWINPCTIDQIQMADGELFARFFTGQVFVLPIQRRSLIVRLERTCLALATLSKEISYFKNRGNKPIDYLPFVESTFSNLLRKRSLLQSFTIPHGEFFKHYERALLLHAYGQLETDLFYM